MYYSRERAKSGCGTSSPSNEFVIAIASGRSDLVAVDDAYTMRRDTTLSIPAPGVLTNDRVPTGLAPRVEFAGALPGENVSGPQNIGNGSGGFAVEPRRGFTGIITLHYIIRPRNTQLISIHSSSPTPRQSQSA